MKNYLKNLEFFSKGETAMTFVVQNAYTCSCDGGLICHPGGENPCYEARLLHGEPEEGSFHDRNLEEATSEINKILDQVRRTEPNRELAIIAAPDGLFLVWVKQGDESDLLRNLLRTK
jgi:hypothetical protein